MAELVNKKPLIQYNSSADGSNYDGTEFPFANEIWFVVT